MNRNLKDIIEGAKWGVKTAFLPGRNTWHDQNIGPGGSTHYVSDLEYWTHWGVCLVTWAGLVGAVGAVGVGVYYLVS